MQMSPFYTEGDRKLAEEQGYQLTLHGIFLFLLNWHLVLMYLL